MIDDESHRRLREQLGSYALGHLSGQESAAVRAHLDGCPACRAELAEIEPVRRGLDLVDPGLLADPPTPPAWLGERIRERVAAERAARPVPPPVSASRTSVRSFRRPAAGRVVRLSAAAAVLLVAAGGGAVLGRATAPEPAAVPMEQIALRPAGDSGLAVESAILVPHTWGVEVRFTGTGFAEGVVYRAAVRSADGTTTPAGEFVGAGTGVSVTCNMQSALLRDETVRFVVRDEAGERVLTADLPAPS
ncbi:zf-HC2 domain-containing protein [Nocardioides donggukensis]|uniref:Zf-HC2 domain-containing protein n=1 Tax=Nocardioides donggukensis TaxID=2774019 RepID=A0A927K1J4_9ACTN|nr:zf-HC2 domain-containing protein [Nocardioides donggukensis]MBD8868389.1 zf-HC2 domain-containing protein [Nocardioides donggukensis]